MTSADEYERRMAERLASLQLIGSQIAESVEADREDDEKQAEEFAASARTGRLGREWQRVQQRIDLGQTTVADVMSGADNSAEARMLRQTSERKLSAVHDGLVADAEADEAEDNPLTQMNQMQLELAQRIEGLRLLVEENRGN